MNKNQKGGGLLTQKDQKITELEAEIKELKKQLSEANSLNFAWLEAEKRHDCHEY